jgi:membrane fusion protein (multidrug efflux system)
MSEHTDMIPERQRPTGPNGSGGFRPKRLNAMSPKRKRIVGTVLAVVALVVIRVAYEHFTWVTTDNAQVSAHTVMLSSRVAGTVEEVKVQENQKVKAGQILAVIDSSTYETKVRQAESELESQRARFHDAEVNFKRVQQLVSKGAVSRQQFDTAQANYRELQKRVASAQAQLDQAKLNLQYTEIEAPSDGTIARRSVEPGMVVPPGQPLFGFVEGGHRWVVANFKETELSGIRLGAHTEVSVDALEGKDYVGEVESISPTTGAVFSLLPPDNATGNFTKVVQRVPVRIRLINLTENDIDHLRAGLSAEVSVRLR